MSEPDRHLSEPDWHFTYQCASCVNSYPLGSYQANYEYRHTKLLTY